MRTHIHIYDYTYVHTLTNNPTSTEHVNHAFSCSSQLEYTDPFGVSVITHTIRHTVGLLWTSDQPVAETSTYTDNTTYKDKRQTSMP
jgi:hypothetical protein